VTGNVGIGTTSPYTKFDVNGQISNRGGSSQSTNGWVNLTAGDTTHTGYVDFVQANGTSSGYIGYVTSSLLPIAGRSGVGLQFLSNASEAMRIDTSGNLLVGVTSSVNGGSAFTSSGTVMSAITASTTNTNMIVFRNGNGNVGTISTNGTTTSYNTSSDYRLKENVTPMTTGLEKISALKPVNYDWISDKSAGEGFIAHELAEVIPLAVHGAKDGVDADGKPVYQGVDYSKIVVHLVAALQELSAKVDAQAAEITALQAKVGA